MTRDTSVFQNLKGPSIFTADKRFTWNGNGGKSALDAPRGPGISLPGSTPMGTASINTEKHSKARPATGLFGTV